MPRVCRCSAVESHISRKTSEMWATQGSWLGKIRKSRFVVRRNLEIKIREGKRPKSRFVR
jgi:hypothetical protein